MLKYVGNGAFLPGIPARDLSEAEVKRYTTPDFLIRLGLPEELAQKNKGADFLIETGLYQKPAAPAAAKNDEPKEGE